MCDGRLLPHWGHLLSRAACQRFAALRVRNRILDVLRFGTPMAGGYESIILVKNNQPPAERLKALQSYNVKTPYFCNSCNV
jgi:hypothetical protein